MSASSSEVSNDGTRCEERMSDIAKEKPVELLWIGSREFGESISR